MPARSSAAAGTRPYSRRVPFMKRWCARSSHKVCRQSRSRAEHNVRGQRIDRERYLLPVCRTTPQLETRAASQKGVPVLKQHFFVDTNKGKEVR